MFSSLPKITVYHTCSNQLQQQNQRHTQSEFPFLRFVMEHIHSCQSSHAPSGCCQKQQCFFRYSPSSSACFLFIDAIKHPGQKIHAKQIPSYSLYNLRIHAISLLSCCFSLLPIAFVISPTFFLLHVFEYFCDFFSISAIISLTIPLFFSLIRSIIQLPNLV